MAADCSDSLGTRLVRCAPSQWADSWGADAELVQCPSSAPFSLELFCLTPLLTVRFDGDSGLFL